MTDTNHAQQADELIGQALHVVDESAALIFATAAQAAATLAVAHEARVANGSSEQHQVALYEIRAAYDAATAAWGKSTGAEDDHEIHTSLMAALGKSLGVRVEGTADQGGE